MPKRNRRKKKNSEEKGEAVVYKGIYRSTSKNYGFVELTEEANEDIPDIFISDDNNMLGAIANDEVLIEVFPSYDIRSKSGKEGIVIEITKRNVTWAIGVLKARNGEYYVATDKKAGGMEIFISYKKLNGASVDNLVKVNLLAEPVLPPKQKRRKKASHDFVRRRRLYGEVAEVFGKKDSAYANYEGILASYGIKQKFSNELTLLANKIAEQEYESIEKAEISAREDLRGETIFTIDSEYAKDLDDAISIDTDENKNYILGVHIADVAHYVKHRSPIDLEAYERGTSVYFIDKVVPMLPKSLSNGICSLSKGEDRLCLSVFMTINAQGNTIKSRFAHTVINSKIKGIYTEINSIFASTGKSKVDKESEKGSKNADTADTLNALSVTDLKKKYKEVMPALKRARRLAKILKKRRIQNGALELYSVESEFAMEYDKETGEPKIVDIKKFETGKSEGMIEEFMLKANEAVAGYLSDKNLPCVYRVHEKPFYEKMEVFAKTLKRLGYSASSLKSLLSKEKEIHPKALQKILKSFEGTPLFQMINMQMLRSLAKARYSHENFGHFGLASDKYCHFTSPIRRYPDLVNHRILKTVILSDEKKLEIQEFVKFTEVASKQSSEKEINAVAAERKIEDLYRAIYMKECIGMEFDGTITSVTGFGVFIMLDNSCEGLVHISNMLGYFEFDSDLMELASNDVTYTIGQRVRIKVVGASISEGSVDFIFS